MKMQKNGGHRAQRQSHVSQWIIPKPWNLIEEFLLQFAQLDFQIILDQWLL